MKKLILAALMLASVLGYAQTTTSITGTIKDLSGAVVTSGQVTFTLRPGLDTTISGSARFVPSTITCTINGSGLVKAADGTSTCTVVNNTSLTPSGSYYLVCIQPNFVAPGSCFNYYALGVSTDISTVVPTPSTSPAFTFVDLFSTQTISGNKTFTGTTTFSGNFGVGALTASSLGMNAAGTATSGANFNSGPASYNGSCWNGAAPVASAFGLQNIQGSGSNPTETLTLTHSGCSGVAAVDLTAAATTRMAALTAQSVGGVQQTTSYEGSSTTCGWMEAIAAAGVGGKVSFNHQGDCAVTSGITITKPVDIGGLCTLLTNDNTYGTITPPTGCNRLVNNTTGSTVITVALPASTFISGVSLHDFAIKGNRTFAGATAGDGIRFLSGGTSTVMRDMDVTNVWITEAFGSNFRVSNNAYIIGFHYVKSFRSLNDGFLMDATTGVPSQIRIDHSDFDLNTGCGIHVSSSGGGSGGDLIIDHSTMADSAGAGGLCLDNGSSATIFSDHNHYESNAADGIHLFGSANHSSENDIFFANGTNDINLSCAGQGFGSEFIHATHPVFLGSTPTNWRVAASCNHPVLDHPSPATPVRADAGAFLPDYIWANAYNFQLGIFNVLGTPEGTGGTATIGLKDTTNAQATPNKYLISKSGQFQLLASDQTTELFGITDPGVWVGKETGAIAGGAGQILRWADSGDHMDKYNDNGAGEQHVPFIYRLTAQYTNSTTGFTTVGTPNIAFPVNASTSYTATCHLYYQAVGTAGLNIEFTGPSAPTAVRYGLLLPVTTGTAPISSEADAFGSSLGAVVGTASTNFDAAVSFSLINGVNAGTVTLLAKSSAAAQLQIQTASYCQVQ